MKGSFFTRKYLLPILAIFVMTPFSQAAYPQTAAGVEIRGEVVDEKGQAIAGATVVVVGTQTGVTSNMGGGFSIKAGAGSTLRISFMGYQAQEINVGNQTDIRVVLAESSSELDELVVVGYGVRSKVSLTGAISTVGGQEITTTKNQNVLNTLTGKLPGVRIVQKGNEPGQFNSTFDIRGLGSPLIVVDGVPRDNITRLDPNEIESITVLKDASAAVYGVRAGNGVVLVTTRKGEEGKIKLDYSFNQAWDKGIGMVEPVDALTQMYMTNEATMTQKYGAANPMFSDADFEPFLNGTRKSTDWSGAMLRSVAPSSTHNLAISGANDKINYFINVGYLSQGSLWKTNISNYERVNIRANIESQIHKRIKMRLKLSGILDDAKQQYEPTITVFSSIWKASPREAIYANDNPSYYNLPAGSIDYNPLSLIDEDISGYRKSATKWTQNSLELIYEIPGVKGLTAKGMYSYDFSSNVRKTFRKSYNLYNYKLNSETQEYGYEVVKQINTPSRVSNYYNEATQTLMQFSLNYTNSFDNNTHNVTGALFYEEQERDGFPFYAKRYVPLPIDQISAGTADQQEAGGWDDAVTNSSLLYKEANRALVGSMHYDYKYKYLVDFNFRYDGSSKFRKGHQFGFFPSASVGWRMSEESFMKNSPALSFVDNLKLRASYGKLGSDDGADPSRIFSGFIYPAGSYIVDGSEIIGAEMSGSVNERLTWYTIKTFNIGVDASFWNEKLGITFDYFRRNRSGLLATRSLSVPGTAGIGLPQENLNSDHTSGFEIVVSHKNRIGDLLYSVTANYSFSRSKSNHVEGADYKNPYDNWRNNTNNRYYGIWWGKKDDGQFQSLDEISRNPIDYGSGNRDMLPGDYKYVDWNGDGIIDGNDDHPILRNSNNGTPLSYLSMNVSASYKSFDFNMLWQGALWNYVYYDIGSQIGNPFVWGTAANTAVLDIFEDRWRPADPKADSYDPDTEWIKSGRPALGKIGAEGTAAIHNARYLRLKSIELGYTLPDKILKNLNIEKVRVYINAYNLFTISPLKDLDPEHPSTGFGADYPLTKTFNCGFNIIF